MSKHWSRKLTLSLVLLSTFLAWGTVFDALAASTDDNLRKGQRVFRYSTFGDEEFWGDTLKLHDAIAGEGLGGVGPGLSPEAALSLGLKVDVNALPRSLVVALRQGKVNLKDPATTVQLLNLDAVLGVKGFFNARGDLKSIGIQCALCHSVVDDSLAPGIGRRLDGWANQDLNIGAIVALAPNLQPFVDILGVDAATVRTVLNSWGPGKFDAELVLDGKAFRPDGKSGATLIPPIFGLAGVNLHTWTGWGGVPYWNAFVAVLEMHGKGTFFDPRLKDAARFPVAAAQGFDDVRSDEDLVTSALGALHRYQLSLQPPRPPEGSFNKVAAARGKDIFSGKARCASCHVLPQFTEPGWNMHTAEELNIDDFQSSRSPDYRYRTTPLRGLWTHMKRGFFHDGRVSTLLEVVNFLDNSLNLELTAREKTDLVEYLKSI